MKTYPIFYSTILKGFLSIVAYEYRYYSTMLIHTQTCIPRILITKKLLEWFSKVFLES